MSDLRDSDKTLRPGEGEKTLRPSVADVDKTLRPGAAGIDKTLHVGAVEDKTLRPASANDATLRAEQQKVIEILHPASHTHRQMNDEQLAEAGVSPGMIRLSVGIENVEDIIADIEQALKNA